MNVCEVPHLQMSLKLLLNGKVLHNVIICFQADHCTLVVCDSE